jgi:hypothetical protein
MTELRVALRTLLQHFRSREALPFDIAGRAAMILLFQDESARNLSEAGAARERLLHFELPDVAQGAFELLSGPNAEVAPRPDLGG